MLDSQCKSPCGCCDESGLWEGQDRSRVPARKQGVLVIMPGRWQQAGVKSCWTEIWSEDSRIVTQDLRGGIRDARFLG